MSREEKLLYARERLKEFQNRKISNKTASVKSDETSPQFQNDASNDYLFSLTEQYAVKNDELYRHLLEANNRISELEETNARLEMEKNAETAACMMHKTADDEYIRAFGDLVAEKTEIITKLSLAESRLEVVESQLQSDNVKVRTTEQNLMTLTESHKRLTLENESNKAIISQYKHEIMSQEAKMKSLKEKSSLNDREIADFKTNAQQRTLQIVQYEAELNSLRSQVTNFINTASVAKSGVLLEDELKLLQNDYNSLKNEHMARGDILNNLENTLSKERGSFREKLNEFDMVMGRYSQDMAHLDEYKAHVNTLEGKIAYLENFIKDLFKENEDNLVQVQKLTQNNTRLTKSNEKLTEFNENVIKTSEEMSHTNEKLTKNIEKLNRDNAEMNTTNDILTRNNNKLTETNKKLTEDAEKLTIFNQKLTFDNNQLTKINANTTKNIEILSENEIQMTKNNEQLEKYKIQNFELNGILSDYKDSQLKLIEEMEELRKETEHYKNAYDVINDEMNSDCIQLKEEVEGLRRQIKELRIELETRKNYIDSLIEKANESLVTEATAKDSMSGNYDNSVEIKRLWEIIEELESQNKAISNYVVLYREQRHVLNHKVIIKDEVIRQKMNQFECYDKKMAKVRFLVESLLKRYENEVNTETAYSILELVGESSVRTNESVEGMKAEEIIGEISEAAKLCDVLHHTPIERLCRDCVGPIYIV